jgi:hypothetical protein
MEDEPSPDFTRDQIRVLKRLSPDQIEFLADFSFNYVNGKKILCWAARIVVAFGVLSAAVAGIIALITQIEWMRGH